MTEPEQQKCRQRHLAGIDTEQPVSARYVSYELQRRQALPAWPWAAQYPPWIFLGQLMVY